MKKYLSFILTSCLLLVSAQAFAVTTAGLTPCLTIGGLTFTDCSSNLIVLKAAVSTNGAAYTSFRQINGSTGYTPSGSNKFRVWAVMCNSSDSTVGNVDIFYKDTNSGIDDSNGTGAFPEGNFGLGTANYQLAAPARDASPGIRVYGRAGLLVPNGKYLALHNNTAAGAQCLAYGYEEP